jgi:hypothetical protein
MSDLDEITAIVKRRYETGEYGDAHFRAPCALFDLWREQVPTPPPGTYAPPRLPGYSLGDLMGIPVVVDDELPAGVAWRLVDSSGVVIREGAGARPDLDDPADSA